MANKHGVQKPSEYLYPPAAKKPTKKPRKKPAKTSAEEGTAGMRSMPLDGSCAYHLAAMASYGTLHLEVPDIDDWPSEAAVARATVLKKYLNMRDLFVEYLDRIPLRDRSDQLSHWESLISEEGDAEKFVANAVDLKKWGGSVAVSYTHLTLPTICSV